MIGATRVEGGLANRATVVAIQVATYTEYTVAVAAVDGFILIFYSGPHYGLVVGLLLVALNAGIERVAALKLDGDDVAL